MIYPERVKSMSQINQSIRISLMYFLVMDIFSVNDCAYGLSALFFLSKNPILDDWYFIVVSSENKYFCFFSSRTFFRNSIFFPRDMCLFTLLRKSILLVEGVYEREDVLVVFCLFLYLKSHLW